MTSTHIKGSTAENLAQQHLISRGWKILATNWHAGHLELDIVARDGNELVIVEVKSRYGSGFAHPSEAITNKQIKRIIDAAETWINTNNSMLETRFDLIIIVFNGDNFELMHYPNAFFPSL